MILFCRWGNRGLPWLRLIQDGEVKWELPVRVGSRFDWTVSAMLLILGLWPWLRSSFLPRDCSSHLHSCGQVGRGKAGAERGHCPATVACPWQGASGSPEPLLKRLCLHFLIPSPRGHSERLLFPSLGREQMVHTNLEREDCWSKGQVGLRENSVSGESMPGLRGRQWVGLHPPNSRLPGTSDCELVWKQSPCSPGASSQQLPLNLGLLLENV